MKGKMSLTDLDLNIGKRTRLGRLLYQYGPANGRLLILPIDQGLEHGPVDFFPNPDSVDPAFQLKLAKKGGYSGIVFHIGLAQKYLKDFEVHAAHRLLTSDAEFHSRKALVERFENLSEDLSRDENEKIVAALTEHGIDWTPAPASTARECPKPFASIRVPEAHTKSGAVLRQYPIIACTVSTIPACSGSCKPTLTRSTGWSRSKLTLLTTKFHLRNI